MRVARSKVIFAVEAEEGTLTLLQKLSISSSSDTGLEFNVIYAKNMGTLKPNVGTMTKK